MSTEDTTPGSLRQTVSVRTGPLSETFAVGELVGDLELIGDRLRFTAIRGKRRQRRWLERRAGIPGLAERIEHGERVVVLDAPLCDANVRFSKLAFGSILILNTSGKKWRFVFFDPRVSADPAGAVKGYASMIKGGKIAAPWRKALRDRISRNTVE